MNGALASAMEQSIERAIEEKTLNSGGGTVPILTGLFHPENETSVAFATRYLFTKGYSVIKSYGRELAYDDWTGHGGKAKMLVMEVEKYSR